MKKLLFILFAVISTVVFKPTAEGGILPTADDSILEGYLLDTTREEMNIISGSNTLLPPAAVRTTPAISIVNNVEKNSTNNSYKQLQSKHNGNITLSIIHRGRINVMLSHKNISNANNYYVFFLERIRI